MMLVFFKSRDDLHCAMFKIQRFPSQSENLTQPAGGSVEQHNSSFVPSPTGSLTDSG